MTLYDDFFGEYIIAYTREEAIKDGVLHDVSGFAAKLGAKVPVAMTNNLWVSIAEKSKIKANFLPYDYEDLKRMLYHENTSDLKESFIVLASFLTVAIQAIRTAIASGGLTDQVHFSFEGIFCYSKIGPGDTLEPVLTFMLEGED